MKIPLKLLLLVTISAICSCNHPASIGVSKVPLQNHGVNIAYTDTGKGDTTLLFVHGWCINKGYWSNQATYFSKKYRVIAIDLPGFGESGKNRSDWSTAAYAHDVDSVIAQLKLKNVILIGHSMAGNIVLQAAIDNPTQVIGLVGVDNFKNVGHAQTAADKKDFDAAIDMLKHNFKAIAFDYFNKALFSKTTDSAIRKRVLNDVDHADTTIAVAAMVEGNNFDELAKLQQAKTKLYLINSDIHLTNTIGLITHKLPYLLLTVHGTGHFPMIEDAKDFNTQLEKIIEDISTGNKVSAK
jgi:pimeloyl-ACP methyl ester carboxylesterase